MMYYTPYIPLTIHKSHEVVKIKKRKGRKRKNDYKKIRHRLYIFHKDQYFLSMVDFWRKFPEYSFEKYLEKLKNEK